MTGQSPPTILQVISERFRWSKATGFVAVPGTETPHGLNRSHEGAMVRIATQIQCTDERRRTFLATLVGEEALATISSAVLSYRGDEHIVEGRRYLVRPAQIDD